MSNNSRSRTTLEGIASDCSVTGTRNEEIAYLSLRRRAQVCVCYTLASQVTDDYSQRRPTYASLTTSMSSIDSRLEVDIALSPEVAGEG